MCCLLTEIELEEGGLIGKAESKQEFYEKKKERVLREKEEIMIMNLECSEEKYVI